MTNSPHRRLAAIMFTDIVGYSAITQRDESLALDLLDEHNKLVRTALMEGRGREIKTVGDAFLVEFDSALEAVKCAIRIQLDLAMRNQASGGEAIRIRVGIHLGDVVYREGDVFGDGVNIAARVQSSAEAGEIRMSEDVARQVGNKIEHKLSDLGLAQLKNITQPVRLFAVEGFGVPKSASAPSGAAPSTAATSASQQPPSIAVLAFANRSANAEDEYFSDGLADELLNVLAKIQGLRVAARTSAFSFKGKDTTAAEIGRALSVSTLLEGSVRKSGNRVRVSVQLVKVDDGFQLWGETYDRTLDDIFAVQDDIAQSVVTELRARLMQRAATEAEAQRAQAEVTAASLGRSENPEAHRLYLEARFVFGRGGNDDIKRSVALLREALTIDPNAAALWAALASAVTDAADFALMDTVEALTEARAAAERAIALAPDMVEGHVAMAHFQTMLAHDWARALSAIRRALQLAPDDGPALGRASHLYYVIERLPEAVECGERAVKLDPLNSLCFAKLAMAYAASGRLSDSEEYLRRQLELSPDRPGARSQLALILNRQGKLEEALQEAVRDSADFARTRSLGVLYYSAGRLAEADEMLARLVAFGDDAGFNIATLHAQRGDLDAAFEWLERGLAANDTGLAYIRCSWMMRPLHSDLRWNAFLKKLGLDDESLAQMHASRAV